MSLEPEGAAERLAVLLEQARPVFESAGNDLALYTAYHGLAQVAFERAQTDAALAAFERAAAHGLAAGMSQEFLEWRAACCYYGTTPVSGLLAWLDEHQPRAGRDHWLRMYRALALAMLGRFDEARPMLAETRTELAERGGGIRLAVTTGIESVEFELLAGDPTVAAELGAEGCRLLEELGDKSFLSTAAASLACALFACDRLEEADFWAGRAAELGASEDAATQRLWRQAKAKVQARRGEHAEAERIAREAVAIGDGTDDLNGQGNACADLAEVLALGRRPDEAAAAFEQALARYVRKGNLVSAQRIRARIADHQSAAPR
jgi:tetratricopeptide (TPR) repeat protein